MKSSRQRKKLEIEKSLLRAERSREPQHEDKRTVEEIFADKRIKQAAEQAVCLSMLAHADEYPQLVTVVLGKHYGNLELQYHLYIKRYDDDARSDVFALKSAWDIAPFNVVRAIDLLIRSNVPDLKHDHHVWRHGEGKSRAIVDRRAIAPYLEGKAIDLSSASLIASVVNGPCDVPSDWYVYESRSVPSVVKLRLVFHDIKTVISVSEAVVDDLKAKGLLVPIK